MNMHKKLRFTVAIILIVLLLGSGTYAYHMMEG